MAKKSTAFSFEGTKTIIMYDLSRNDVSASTIAAKSSNLYTSVKVNDNSYNLPNTTLGSGLEKKEDAEKEFKTAFSKTESKSTISRLFVIEVYKENGYIENDE